MLCAEHRNQSKGVGTIDVHHRVCQHPECCAVARYGFAPITRASAQGVGGSGSRGVGQGFESLGVCEGVGSSLDCLGGIRVQLDGGGGCNSSVAVQDSGSDGGVGVCVGQRQFCRKHRREGQVCLDYKCSLCGQHGHWRAKCSMLAPATGPVAAATVISPSASSLCASPLPSESACVGAAEEMLQDKVSLHIRCKPSDREVSRT